MKALYVVVIAAFLLWPGLVGAGFPTVSHEGRDYVELSRIAEGIKGKVDASADATQARLHIGAHVVTFTRNWARIVVDDSAVVLDAPARFKDGAWLVPQSFVTLVLPRLAPPAPAAKPASPPPIAARPPAPKPTPPPSVAASPPAAKPASPPASPKTNGAVTALSDLRFRSYPTFTRVVLETSGAATHRVEAGGANEARFRLPSIRAESKVIEIKDGFVDEVRVESTGTDAIVRVVFEGTAGSVRATSLADPFRIVFDFTRPTVAKPREQREAVAPLRVIVLDAGHGGHDSGAVGPGGLMEKDLVLDVTRRVAKLVEAKLDVRVILSRDADHFVTLRDRTSFANRERADLFVSIHANAHPEVASEGVETYFLSSEATDSAARQVAALENSAGQPERASHRGRAEIVKTILWDLAQSEFQFESSRLAETVQDSMTQALRIPNRGVKQAGFYVLGGAAMPAILIEIGFVTNPKEERKLKESRYRDEIARAIFAGIAEYKRSLDPRARSAAR
jgi:N-acetylmuramoyl-L-alanine amidase